MPETTLPPSPSISRTSKRPIGDRYAYTRSKGQMISLGRYGTEKSHARFREIEEAWVAEGVGQGAALFRCHRYQDDRSRSYASMS